MERTELGRTEIGECEISMWQLFKKILHSTVPHGLTSEPKLPVMNSALFTLSSDKRRSLVKYEISALHNDIIKKYLL